MAMPVRKMPEEKSVEERLARVETHLEHLGADVSDSKTELRRLAGKIDHLEEKLMARMSAVENSAVALSLRIERFKLWAVMFYIGGMGGLLFVLARGFKWL